LLSVNLVLAAVYAVALVQMAEVTRERLGEEVPSPAFAVTILVFLMTSSRFLLGNLFHLIDGSWARSGVKPYLWDFAFLCGQGCLFVLWSYSVDDAYRAFGFLDFQSLFFILLLTDVTWIVAVTISRKSKKAKPHPVRQEWAYYNVVVLASFLVPEVLYRWFSKDATPVWYSSYLLEALAAAEPQWLAQITAGLIIVINGGVWYRDVRDSLQRFDLTREDLIAIRKVRELLSKTRERSGRLADVALISNGELEFSGYVCRIEGSDSFCHGINMALTNVRERNLSEYTCYCTSLPCDECSEILFDKHRVRRIVVIECLDRLKQGKIILNRAHHVGVIQFQDDESKVLVEEDRRKQADLWRLYDGTVNG
jgi:hypothetical protein